MSIKKIVDEMWKDEILRENKITKIEIKLILEAFKRYIPEKIVEDGEFKFLGLFTLKVKSVRGWNSVNFKTGEKVKINDFKRIYISPSKKLKNKLNNK